MKPLKTPREATSMMYAVSTAIDILQELHQWLENPDIARYVRQDRDLQTAFYKLADNYSMVSRQLATTSQEPLYTANQKRIMRGLVDKAGARLVGTHLSMPVIRDRDGNLFAVTPTGDTLRVVVRKTTKEERSVH